MICEKTITILNHLRANHKDIAALIKLQRNLKDRRDAMMYLKRREPHEYGHVLRLYGLTDFNCDRGEGLHKEHFMCKRRKGAPALRHGN